MDFSDRPSEVRQGEELPQRQLQEYLQHHLGVEEPLEISQFPSGYSNLTYLIGSKDRQLVLRRGPFGSKVKKAHDMGREYFVLSKIHSHYPLVPKPLLYCDEEDVIGASFYVMEKISGVILRKDLPPGLSIDEKTARQLAENFVDNLVRLHQIDYRDIGLGDWGRPEGYAERQVKGWIKRYHGSQTDEIEGITEIIAWLQQRIPNDTTATIVHNDYKYDNLVLDPGDITRIIGVLDWEMATIGDPLMDLGTSLGYWIEPNDPEDMKQLRFLLTTLPGTLTRSEIVERYAQSTGADVSNMLFYYCFAVFKLAVILQQIYYRYAKGHTQDPRFSSLIHMVRGLSKVATRAMAAGKF